MVERSSGRVTVADSAMPFPTARKGEESQQRKVFSKGADWERKEKKKKFFKHTRIIPVRKKSNMTCLRGQLMVI